MIKRLFWNLFGRKVFQHFETFGHFSHFEEYFLCLYHFHTKPFQERVGLVYSIQETQLPGLDS